MAIVIISHHYFQGIFYMKNMSKGLIFMGSALALIVLATSCSHPVESDTELQATKKGWNQYRLGNFNLAVNTFKKALETSPSGSEDYYSALYGLATTWNLRRPDQDTDKAEELYRRILQEDPDNRYAPWSALALARMLHLVPVGQEPDYKQVRAAYKAVIDRYPDHMAAEEAFLYLQSTYLQQLDEESARLVIQNVTDFIEAHPQSKYRSPAYSILATCYEVLGDGEKRLDYELKAYETAEIDPNNPFQDNSWRYWLLATMAEFDAGNFDLARKFYNKLLDEYPQDIRKYGAQQALKRMDRVEAKLRAELKEVAP